MPIRVSRRFLYIPGPSQRPGRYLSEAEQQLIDANQTSANNPEADGGGIKLCLKERPLKVTPQPQLR